MKKFILGITLLIFGQSYAQIDMSSFKATGRGGVATTFATDYQAIGVNPANLGFRKSFRDPLFTVNLIEPNASFFTEALSRSELLSTILNPSQNNFSLDEKANAADRFAGTDFNFTLDATLLAGAISMPKIGGFAFSVRDRILFYANLSKNVTDLAFMGKYSNRFTHLELFDGRKVERATATEEELAQTYLAFFENSGQAEKYSKIFNGTTLSLSWLREYNFSYGRQIVDKYNFSMHIGAGIRYVTGVALIDIEVAEDSLQRNIISASPSLGFQLGNDPNVAQSPTFRGNENANLFQKLFMGKPVGSGVGFDLGINMVIRRNLYIGAAVTNLGNMSWDGNVAQLNDSPLVQIKGTGFNSFNFLVDNRGVLEFAGKNSPFTWSGATESKKQELPSLVRLGASYEYFKMFHVGIDILIPRNQVAGNLTHTLYAIGGDYQLNRLFRLSSGLSYGGNSGNYVNLPFGVTYVGTRRLFEAGISSLDIRSLLLGIGSSANMSIAFGLRLRLL